MIKPPPRTASPRHDIPGENAEIARLSEMVVTLLGELSVVTERLDTVERLLERGQLMRRADIEAFVPDAQAQAERDGRRQRLVRKLFRPLRIAAEREAELATQAAQDSLS
jgi:hypothetical protein